MIIILIQGGEPWNLDLIPMQKPAEWLRLIPAVSRIYS